jgi:predicted site-specific integrase-resolvase
VGQSRPEEVGTVYSRKEAAARLHRSVSTLKVWARRGYLVPLRYPSGQVFYTEAQLDAILRPPSPEPPPPTPE